MAEKITPLDELNEWGKFCYGRDWLKKRQSLTDSISKKTVADYNLLDGKQIERLIHGIVKKINSQPIVFPGSKQYNIPRG